MSRIECVRDVDLDTAVRLTKVRILALQALAAAGGPVSRAQVVRAVRPITRHVAGMLLAGPDAEGTVVKRSKIPARRRLSRVRGIRS